MGSPPTSSPVFMQGRPALRIREVWEERGKEKKGGEGWEGGVRQLYISTKGLLATTLLDNHVHPFQRTLGNLLGLSLYLHA